MSSEVLICKLSFPHKRCSCTKSRAASVANSGRHPSAISDFRRNKQLLLRTKTSFPMTNNYKQRKTETEFVVAVHTGLEPEPPIPPDPSPGSWKFFILGMLVSVVIPSWRNKFLLPWKQKFESTIESAEQVTEVVEELAEEVEKVAEDVAELLPENGKLKGAVTFVENVAKETVKEAELARDILEKVEEVEKEMSSLVEVETNKDQIPITKEVKDQ